MANTYKVRDNVTGKIIEVPAEQLGNYGLGAQAPPAQPPITMAPATPLPTTTPAGKSNKPQTITGHTLEEHATALAQAKAKGDKNAVKSIQDDYGREYQYQKDTGAIAKPEQQKKKEDSYAAQINFISNLEKHFQGAGGGEASFGPLARALGVLKWGEGKIGLNDQANTYNDEKAGYAATLKALTGDTGVLTDSDFKRLVKLVPGLGATPGEAKMHLNDLRGQMAAKYQEKQTATTIKPEGKGVGDYIMPRTRDVITHGSDRLAQKRAAMPDAKGNFGQILLNAAQDTGNFGKEVASTAPELLNAALLLSGGKGLLKNPTGVLASPKAALGKVFTQGAGGKLRDEAVATATQGGKQIEGEKIAQHMLDWATTSARGNLGKGKAVQKIAEDAIDQFGGKKLTPDEAMKVWRQIDSGFKQSGMTKTTVEGLGDKALRDAIRKELDTATEGGFEKGTKMIAKGIQRKKTAKWAGGIAGGGLVSAATFALLGKMLNQNHQN